MGIYRIGFRFSGGLADSHRLDGWDGKEFHDGARRFLALNAHFFVHTAVPAGGAINHTRFYRIYEGEGRSGSILLPYFVEFLPGIAEHFSYGVSAAAGAWTFNRFLKRSLENIWSESEPPPELWERIEPVLSADAGNKSPIVDVDRELEYRWTELRGRGASACSSMFYPVGRSADRCSVEIGDLAPIVIEPAILGEIRFHARQYKEQQITEAVHRFRSGPTHPS